VDPGTIETAELLISELVTNAAGASGQPARAGQADDGSIWLSLRMVCRRLTIEVTDLDPNPPVLLYVGQDAESGRGLMLVDALSADWDYFHPPSGGKTVFCVIELPPAPPGCAGDARHRDHEERKTA
jgi:anti-sigma regulatory factor (Ser/Thr protein kinase)